jgi:hypothetical protein
LFRQVAGGEVAEDEAQQIVRKETKVNPGDEQI